MASPDCSKAREWAALAPDGTLTRLEAAALDRHLARCPQCRAFADTVQWLTGALGAEQLEAAPPIRRRLHERLARRRTSRRALLGAGAVAAAVLVASIGGATREPAGSTPLPFTMLYGPGTSRDPDRP